jgi:hypothetical protein
MSISHDGLFEYGGVPVGLAILQPRSVRWVYSSSSAEPYKSLSQQGVDLAKVHSTVLAAHAATTSDRNDTVFITPEAHTISSTLTWSNNMTHLIGMYPPAMQNQRAKLCQGATFNSMVTVSGYGNLFQNLYFDYGDYASSATNKTILTLSGSRNSFVNCHFLLADGLGADLATDYAINISGDENYFKNCFFGNDTISFTAGTFVQFTAGDGRAVFEDCIFLVNADANTYRFVGWTGGVGSGATFFKRCTFINIGTAMTYGIDGTGLNNCKAIFDHSQIGGATDIVASTYENYVWMSGYQEHDTAGTNNIFNVGLMQHPDVS